MAREEQEVQETEQSISEFSRKKQELSVLRDAVVKQIAEVQQMLEKAREGLSARLVIPYSLLFILTLLFRAVERAIKNIDSVVSKCSRANVLGAKSWFAYRRC